MKYSKISTLAIVLGTSALTSGAANAEAAGFAPWQHSGIASVPDAEQQSVAITPFYQDGLARFRDAADPRQADVDVQAWYAAARRPGLEPAAGTPLAAR